MNMKCLVCETKDKELRPYGPNSSWICFSCSMKPGIKEVVEKNFKTQLTNATNHSKIVVIGETTGPRPLSGESLQ